MRCAQRKIFTDRQSEENPVDRRLTPEDINWLCRMGIARAENRPLRNVPASVARRLTVLRCAEGETGQYAVASSSLPGRDGFADREVASESH